MPNPDVVHFSVDKLNTIGRLTREISAAIGSLAYAAPESAMLHVQRISDANEQIKELIGDFAHH